MRAEPPRPRRGRDNSPVPARTPLGVGPRQRCPYLEQILKERGGPFGMLTRYKADCHVDRRTHRFTGRNPSPPCITDPTPCPLYRSMQDEEIHRITRYTD